MAVATARTHNRKGLFCYYKQIRPHIFVINHLGPDHTAMPNIWSISGKNVSKLRCLFFEFVGFTLMCLQSSRRTNKRTQTPLQEPTETQILSLSSLLRKSVSLVSCRQTSHRTIKSRIENSET